MVLRRGENRYYIEDVKATHVLVVLCGDGQETDRHEGHLADLSMHGVRIILPTRLEPGREIELQITVQQIALEMKSPAVVRWADPRDHNSWWIGCEMDESFTPRVIENLAAAGILNRRRDPRYAVSKKAWARWELSEDVVDVELVNYSKGGFCFVTDRDLENLSERVMVCFDDGARQTNIPAKVMWQRLLEDDRHGYGCAFTSLDGYVRLRRQVEPTQCASRTEIRLRRLGFFSVPKWVVVAVAVLLCVQVIALLRELPARGPLLSGPRQQRQVEASEEQLQDVSRTQDRETSESSDL